MNAPTLVSTDEVLMQHIRSINLLLFVEQIEIEMADRAVSHFLIPFFRL